MLYKFCKITIFLLLFTFTSENVYASSESHKFIIVGVENRVRITNLNTGRIVRSFPIIKDYLTEFLSDCDKIAVLDNTEQIDAARTKEIIFQLSQGSIPADLKRLNPDYLIYGYLNDVGIKTSGQGIAAPTMGGLISAGGDSKTVSVRLSVKILNVHTGKEVFVATGHGQSGAVKNAQAGYQMHSFKIGSKVAVESALHNALYKAVQQVADKIIREA